MLRTYHVEEVERQHKSGVEEIHIERLYPGQGAARGRTYRRNQSPLRASRLEAIAESVKRGYLLDCYNMESGYSSYVYTTYGVPK